MGRVLGVLLIVAAIGGGAGMWYLQVYAFYDEFVGGGFALRTPDGPVLVEPEGMRGIDATSSPLRYRACFAEAIDPVGYLPHPDPVPTVGPDWFECYDADATAAALRAGEAVAVEAESGVYGIDRLVALWPDRGVVWHQLNPCGDAVYAGRPVPEGCPPPPEAYLD